MSWKADWPCAALDDSDIQILKTYVRLSTTRVFEAATLTVSLHRDKVHMHTG